MHLGRIFMVDSVVAKLMPVVYHLLHDRRKVQRRVGRHEKCGVDTLLVVEVKEPLHSHCAELAT